MKVYEVKGLFAMADISAQTVLMEVLSLNPLFHRTIIRPMETCRIVDLTPTQMRTLYSLAVHDHIPMGSLAEHLDISKQQLTKVIDILVEKGYVERVVNAANRRQVVVQLSAKGATLVDNVLATIADDLEPSFSKFTEEEKEAFYNASITLKKLMEHINYDL